LMMSCVMAIASSPTKILVTGGNSGIGLGKKQPFLLPVRLQISPHRIF
jgi:hypothetical protein